MIFWTHVQPKLGDIANFKWQILSRKFRHKTPDSFCSTHRFLDMAVLKVEMFGIATIVLYLQKKDTVDDVKHLLGQMTSIPHNEISLKHGQPSNMDVLEGNVTIGEFSVDMAGYSRAVACFGDCQADAQVAE